MSTAGILDFISTNPVLGIMEKFDFASLSQNLTRNETTGVYFLIRNKKIVYVGQSKSLYERPFNHAAKGKKYDTIQTLLVPEEFLDFVESAFVGLIKPEYNGGEFRRRKDSNYYAWGVSDDDAFSSPELALSEYNVAFLKNFKNETGEKISRHHLKQFLHKKFILSQQSNQLACVSETILEKTFGDKSLRKTPINLTLSHRVKALGHSLAEKNSLSLSSYISQLILREFEKDTCP